jgi:cell division transport system permease protein
MNRLLRYHQYALIVTLRRLAQQPFSLITNVMVIALALTLPLIGAAILTSVQPVARHVSANPTLTVFMQISADLAQTQAIVGRIQKAQDPAILEVKLIDKDQALTDLKRNDAWQQALAVLPSNPLPHAITVTLAAQDAVSKTADLFAREWQAWDGVAFVQLDSLWVQRLEALLRLGKIGLALVTLVIALVVLAAVFNTVRMQALSQRDEIAVARLVGATESFVRRPFLYQGGLTCGVGTLIAIGLAWLTLRPLNEALGALSKTYDALFALSLPGATELLLYLIAAVVLGALSARWSVTRHTRF